MKIHELNNFTGTLGAGSYVAVDDGNDTGKVSTQQILAGTEARIDNIIAGEAPSAAEVTDARYGADGVTYTSLGTAIRTQFTDLKAEINEFGLEHFNLYSGVNNTLERYINSSTGALVFSASYQTSDYIDVEAYANSTLKSSYVFSGCFYDSSKTFISGSEISQSILSDNTISVPATAKYCRICCANTDEPLMQIGKNVSRDNYQAYKNYSLDGVTVEGSQVKNLTVSESQVAGLSDDLSNIHAEIDDFGFNLYNLYSGVGNTLERYVNSSTGELNFNASYQASDYIDVSKYAGKTIKTSYVFSGCFYDPTKTFISGSGFSSSEITDNPITVPASAKYCRISFANTNESKVQVGTDVSRLNYIPYGEYHLKNLDIYDWFEIDNLFDKSTVLANKYIGPNDGGVGSLNGYNASDWIEIGEGNYVTASNCWDMVVYNSDRSYSRNVTRRYDNYPLTTKLLSGEKYVRVTAVDAYLPNVKVEINIGASAYTHHGRSVKSNEVADVSYKMTTIYVGTGCYFTTINDALTAITDNTEKNRYTLFLTEGEYAETLTTKDYVDIVGENKYKSIINYVSDDESDYVNRSTIFASTYTTLKNLTVRTTGSKYPLHCDARYNEPYEVKAENCIFKHDGFTSLPNEGTAVGIGLYWGQHVKLKECECLGTGGFGSASIYCHNSSENDASHSRFRSLSIKNCVLSNSYYGLRLQAIENNALQANECVYIGNKNSGEIPVSLENNGYQSWHILSIGNEPSYTQP